MTDPGSRRVTLRDIAAEVGMSVNTVSRALAGKHDVGKQTRARVRAVADRLGYVPNSMARSLVLGATMTLGLVITLPSNPFYAQLISAVEQRVRKYGYSLLLVVTEEDTENEKRAVQDLLRWGVGGALVVPVQGEVEHLRRLDNAGVPVVLVNRNLPELQVDFVGVDNVRGVRELTRHVIDQGTRKVCLLEEDLAVSTVTERRQAFEAAMADAGLHVGPDTFIDVPSKRRDANALPWEPTESYAAARDVLSARDRPTAILVGNDYLALGVYRAAAEAGLRIPQDLIVAGYGDHPYAGYLNPALTTVRLPAAQVGATAVDIAVRRLRKRGTSRSSAQQLLEPELIVRDSSHPAPATRGKPC